MATFNPNTGAASPVDGLLNSAQGAWATIQPAANASSVSVSDASQKVAQVLDNGGSSARVIRRSIFCFDTSSLGAGATILSAVFGFVCTTKSSTVSAGDNTLHVCGTNPATTDNLVGADYGTFGSTSFGSIAYASVTADSATYNNITLNASGIAAINKAGVTTLGLRVGADITNVEPTFSGFDTIRFDGFYADNGTNKPRLVVTLATGISVLIGGGILKA